MAFRKTKSFGPKVALTDLQAERLETMVVAAGLTCDIENSWTGSCYIEIGLPEWEQNIAGEWYHTCDVGMGSRGDLAKIRLSGHDEGRRQDSTHTCTGSKKMCMELLKRWVDKIIAAHGPKGRAILAEKHGPLAP